MTATAGRCERFDVHPWRKAVKCASGVQRRTRNIGYAAVVPVNTIQGNRSGFGGAHVRDFCDVLEKLSRRKRSPASGLRCGASGWPDLQVVAKGCGLVLGSLSPWSWPGGFLSDGVPVPPRDRNDPAAAAAAVTNSFSSISVPFRTSLCSRDPPRPLADATAASAVTVLFTVIGR